MKYFPDGIRIISLLPNHQTLWRNLSHTTCTLQGTNDSVMATAHQDSFLYETSGAFFVLTPLSTLQGLARALATLLLKISF